jgi:AraC-like DNA-binding protein
VADNSLRVALPPPGGVAWLDISASQDAVSGGRTRTGPLGMQIAPLDGGRSPYSFKGARLRGTRCIWTAATVSGAELHRPALSFPGYADGAVHLVVRAECEGSVFDAASSAADRATLRVVEPLAELRECFEENTHLFTLNIQRGTLGVESAVIEEMLDREFELTRFQFDLIRSAVSLLENPGEELGSAQGLLGVDRYLGALAGLVLRTTARRQITEIELMESIRSRTGALIFEQAADAALTPAVMAEQLGVSLRQLYRAFTGTESPAARIRRRRLDLAADLLLTETAPGIVEKVARDCGFVSAEYFSRVFRREFGVSPRTYRSDHRDRILAGRS